MYSFKINVIGIEGAGKEKFIQQCIGRSYQESEKESHPFSGIANITVDVKSFVEKNKVEFFEWNLIDGPAKLRANRDQEYYGFHALILVVDLSDKNSLINDKISDLLEAAKKYPNTPIFIVATHKDPSKERQISNDDLSKFIKNNELHRAYYTVNTSDDVKDALSNISAELCLKCKVKRTIDFKKELDDARKTFEQSWNKTLDKSFFERLKEKLISNEIEVINTIKDQLKTPLISYRNALYKALSSTAKSELRYYPENRCDLIKISNSDSPNDFKNYGRNQYIIKDNEIWFWSPTSKNPTELTFKDEESRRKFKEKLTLSNGRCATKEDIELITSCTGHIPENPSVSDREQPVIKQINAIDYFMAASSKADSLDTLSNCLKSEWEAMQTTGIPKSIWSVINDFITSVSDAISQALNVPSYRLSS